MAKKQQATQQTLDDELSPDLNDELAAGDGGEGSGESAGDVGDVGDGGGDPGGEEDVAAPSWRDQAKNFGIDLSTYQDDESAFRHLSDRIKQAETLQSQLEQSQPLVQYGQEYLNHAADFQRWRQEQEAAKQQQEPDPYAPPEFDPTWYSMVKYDQNGVVVPDVARGGTPEIVSKLQTFTNWQKNFLSNPYKHIEGFVDKRAEERAKSLIQEEIGKLSENFHAQQFLSNNRDWLFQRDQNGQQVMEQDGRPALTEEGKVFRQFLTQAAEDGLNSQQQQAVAMRMLDVWRQGRARGNAGANGGGSGKPRSQQRKEDFLTQAAGFTEQVDEPAASTRRSGKDDDLPQNTNQTLEEMMRAEFKAAGITDEDFARV